MKMNTKYMRALINEGKLIIRDRRENSYDNIPLRLESIFNELSEELMGE